MQAVFSEIEIQSPCTHDRDTPNYSMILSKYIIDLLLKFPNSQSLFPCKVFFVGINKDLIFVSMQIFPIRSFYVDMQGSVHLKSIFRPIFALKSTIFCHFAGYASALETIWLHGLRDLFLSGPHMA